MSTRAAILLSTGILVAVLCAVLVAEFAGRREARRLASDRLRRAHTLAMSRLARDGENLEQLAATIARDPKFFALVALRRSERTTTYRRSLEGVIREFQADAPVEIFDVTDEWGATVAASSRPAAPEPSRGASPLVRHALEGTSALGYRLEGGRLYRIAVVPILAEGRAPIGTLTLGALVDDGFAAVVRGATGADVLLLAGEVAPQGGATANARPVVSTLSLAGARSVLETLGPSPRSIGRSRLRDERKVWIAKAPARALDVSLDGAMEGGVARLIVATPLDFGAATGPSREAILAIGALLALLLGVCAYVLARRLVIRMRALRVAVRGAATEGSVAALPEVAGDELGLLTAEIGATVLQQRAEIDRMAEADRRKVDFLIATAREIEAPIEEIRTIGAELERWATDALGPKGLERVRVVREHAETIGRLARDLADMENLLAPSKITPEETDVVPFVGRFEPIVPKPDLEVVPAEEPVEVAPIAAAAAPVPAAAPVAAAAPAPPTIPAPAPPPTATHLPDLDIARLVEGVAVDCIVEAAQRGIEVSIVVEPRLFYPTADGAAIERAIREHAAAGIASLAPGSSIGFIARQTPTGIEIRVEGPVTPLEMMLPLVVAARA